MSNFEDFVNTDVYHTIQDIDLKTLSDVMTTHGIANMNITAVFLLNAFLGMKNILKYDGNDLHIKIFENEIYSEFGKSNGNNLRSRCLINDKILQKNAFFCAFVGKRFRTHPFVVSRNKFIIASKFDLKCASDFCIRTIIINNIEYTFDDNDELNLVHINIENTIHTVWLVYPFEDTVEDFMDNECLSNEIIENVSIVYTDGLGLPLYPMDDDYANTSL